MNDMFNKLKTLQTHAHCPYSKYQVAAILVLEDGTEISGVNVENASYGGTICAERSAIVSACSQHGADAQFKEMHLLAGENDNFAMPCGLCRQFMSEFFDDSVTIYVYTGDGRHKSITMSELLPHSFSKADLE